MDREPTSRDDSLSPTQLLEINRICDRFEAAWRAGRRPAAEDHLGDAAGPVRSARLAELLATELECRRSLGESPARAEYRARFPDDAATVEAAFARVGPPMAPPAAVPDVGRNLLFGLLALQNDFIGRDDLLAAFNAWVADKSRTLGGILLGRGALDAPRHALLEALVGEHLRRHGGDPERSLAAMAMGGSTRDVLKGVGDPDLDASLSLAGKAAPAGDDDITPLYGDGTATDGGRRFRVLRPHAKGGLGAVFVALDAELHREVALKEILDRHADDPISRQRFLLEAEITGGLEHPGIVPVYGLGTYADGRPFYAMRFVQGDSLKAAIAAFHADPALRSEPGARSLALSKLLRRFLDVCNAIAYAHNRGVLHRDLKPGNILMGPFGETLVVDWGLAKVIGTPDAAGEATLRPPSASGTSETLPGSALGTPAYMSPEQAEGRLDQLGPATDVYSLGATLYCLLTGRAPIEGAGAEVEEILRRVRSGDFPPPRRVEPGVPRALEAICLKAMSPRPEARYGSPRALAEDIERWLADEPVSAYREGEWARLARWSRRHRSWVRAGAAALVVGLIAAIALAVQQSHAAERERTIAEREGEARKAEQTAREAEQRALAVAQARLAQLEKANDLLTAVFKDLDPHAEEKEGKPLRAILGDRLRLAAAQLKGEAIGDPATVAKLQDALGESLLGLGSPADAIELFSRSAATREAKLGPEHPDTLSSRNYLAEAYRAVGRQADGARLHEANLKRFEARLGPEHPDTLSSRNNLAEAYINVGRQADGAGLHEVNLRMFEAKLGPDHVGTLTSRNNLAEAYIAVGRPADGARLHEINLKMREAKLGPGHYDTLVSRSNLASAYGDLGRRAEAAGLHEVNLRMFEAKLGPDHASTLTSRNNLAWAYHNLGRFEEAITLWKGLLPTARRVFGPSHARALTFTGNLAMAYESLNRWAEAELHRREVLMQRRKTTPAESPVLASDLTYLGRNLLKQAKCSEAEVALRKGLAIREKVIPNDWSRFNTASLLGEALLAMGRYAEAEPLIVQGYEGMKAREASIPASARPRLPEAAERMVRLYEAWGQPGKAEEWKRKLGLADLPADVFAPAPAY